jgi:hypothetical protein
MEARFSSEARKGISVRLLVCLMYGQSMHCIWTEYEALKTPCSRCRGWDS